MVERAVGVGRVSGISVNSREGAILLLGADGWGLGA